jgi:two-component system cell cycle response regulator DivK
MAGELILITEDHEKNRKLIREVLQVTGYQTLETETAEEGIRLAHEFRPALILMDLQLPGMDGIEALAALRADPATRPIPVIAVTASAMTHSQADILAAGFDGYQTKPISVKEFLRLVREVLDRPRAGTPPP